jgi:hypothetical protein
MVRTLAVAAIVLLALIGCEQAPVPSSTTETVPVRIEPGSGLSRFDWERTDTIRLRAVSTQKSVLVDTAVPFLLHELPSLSAPSDQGISIEASGYDSIGARIWLSSLFLSPGSATTAVLEAFPVPIVERTATAALPTVRTSPLDSPDSLLLQLDTPTPSTAIHFSLDGSNPTALSARYERPLRARLPCRLRAIAIGDSAYPSLVLDTIFPAGQDNVR